MNYFYINVNLVLYLDDGMKQDDDVGFLNQQATKFSFLNPRYSFVKIIHVSHILLLLMFFVFVFFVFLQIRASFVINKDNITNVFK